MKRLVCIIVPLFITSGCGKERATVGIAPARVDTAATNPATSDRPEVSLERSSAGEAAAAASAKKSAIPRLLYFTRDHCLPCEIMAPWIDAIKKRYEPALEVQEVNLDRMDNRAISQALNVRTIPTQVYVGAGGRELHRHQGLATQKEMVKVLCDLNLVACSPR